MNLNINDTFTKELPADPVKENYVRKVTNSAFSVVKPTKPSLPAVIHVSDTLLADLGLTESDTLTKEFLDVFSGSEIYPNTQPFAMCYGGHQFGHWAGQLGDGRAINLFEILNKNNRWAIQLKGAGKTPYSRTADGLAVLRSSIREYLCSEAMYHLNVPTTRALSIMLSGDEVLRDILYNGNPDYEKGAIVTRVAPSFIRFGNFEIFSARRDLENLKKLTDYTITHFYPHLGEPNPEVYLAFFEEVMSKTLQLMIDWERVGFVHGVMNTDNMSILGLTIDYGPYGWLEDYDPLWTPNTTDAGQKRYRYGNQGQIGMWNLLQLGNTLFSLIGDVKPLQATFDTQIAQYETKRYRMLETKIGLYSEDIDKQFIDDLLELLTRSEMDMTLFFRALSSFNISSPIESFIKKIAQYSYASNFNAFEGSWQNWLEKYAECLKNEPTSNEDRVKKMNLQNPKYVLRNYMAQLAIDKANEGDYGIIDELYQLLKSPYDEQPENEKWFAKRPDWAKHKVGCSMLSCSS